MDRRTFSLEIHREAGGYWTEVPDLPGCFASGRTLDELVAAVHEGIAMYITDTDDDEQPVDQILTRVISLELSVEPDLRPVGAEQLTTQGPRRRDSHPDDRRNLPPREAG
jgi:predicted RNase H-like HicB family nuclease